MGGHCILRRKYGLINKKLIATYGITPLKFLTQDALEAPKTTQLLPLLLVTH